MSCGHYHGAFSHFRGPNRRKNKIPKSRLELALLFEGCIRGAIKINLLLGIPPADISELFEFQNFLKNADPPLSVQFQTFLARACGIPAVGVRAVDCWQTT